MWLLVSYADGKTMKTYLGEKVVREKEYRSAMAKWRWNVRDTSRSYVVSNIESASAGVSSNRVEDL